MPDKNLRTPENVPGKYYVDNTCIDCGLCPETAPQCFARQAEGGYSYVFNQPRTAEEISLAEEARSCCPTDSIGNDGD